MQLQQTLRRGWSHITLAVILLATYGAMAVRGFNLGLYSDVLAYIWHYETRGIRGGMNWLVVEHWQRHLAGALASAPIQVLFPGDDAIWFAIALGLHFTNAFLFFAFVDDWTRGKYRMVVFVGVLLFAFDTLQIDSHLTFGTATHRKASMTLTIVFLWLYMRYVRGDRQRMVLYSFSLLAFSLGNAIYEQALLLFLIFPLFALIEDWQKPVVKPWWRYGLRVAFEMFPFGFFVLSYAYLIDVLFISSNVEASAGYVVGQVGGAVNAMLNPLAIVTRIGTVFTSAWIVLAALVTAVLAALLWRWGHRTESMQSGSWQLLALGAGIMLLNAVSVAPTDFSLVTAPRLVYTAGLGSGLLIAALLDWLRRVIPSRQAGGVVFAGVSALIIGTGAAHFFQQQQFYLVRDDAREAVKAAIYTALPGWDEETPPYLLIITDAHPFDDLALYAQDIGFPFMFDLMYSTEGILADAVYTDIEASPETSGQHIIATAEGIISPLRPDLRIDPARLVVISYSSTSDTAEVLDTVPPDVLADGNLHAEVPFTWETNLDYLD